MPFNRKTGAKKSTSLSIRRLHAVTDFDKDSENTDKRYCYKSRENWEKMAPMRDFACQNFFLNFGFSGTATLLLFEGWPYKIPYIILYGFG